MTNQNNEILMEYLTGNLTITQNQNEVYFEEFESKKNNLEHLMEGLYFPFGYTIDGKLQGITSASDGTQYSIIYGKYKQGDADTYSHSYILILDESYLPKQLIKQYSNGDYFGAILGINYGEDGRFFLVEKDTNGYYRFVLLNNILVKSPDQEDFKVVMRQTYRIDDQTFIPGTPKVEIEKEPGNSKYVMLFTQAETVYRVKCIEFTINVGSTNEWKYYGAYSSIGAAGNYDYIISWNSDNQFELNFVMTSAYYDEYHDYNIVEIVVASKEFTSDTMHVGVLWPEEMSNIDKNANVWADVKFINSEDYYVSIAVNNNYYLFKNHAFSNVPFFTLNNATSPNFTGIRLFNKNNNIFFTYQNGGTYVGLIIDEELYTSEFTDFNADKTIVLLDVQNIFNLYLFYIQCGDYINTAKLVYVDKTNNTSYVNETSLVPYFGKLYDENGNLVFARTLYNKSISEQTTTSTILVPNLYLNDAPIGGEKLIGKTYVPLVDENEVIDKNQYEELFVNFANTISIQNHNDPNNVILNPAGAVRFNQSITGTNDYDYCKAVKYRINYSDGTSVINAFTGAEITQIDNEPPWTYRYSLKVFNPADNEILSIDILSSDENTKYQTIENMGLDPNGLYTITQDVYVI